MYAKRSNTRKAVLVLLAVVLVIGCAIGGTIAYLQMKTDPVINTFSPSNINLTLEETATEGGNTKANTYKMVPGMDIAKDPKVTVTADIDSYVFVKVEESDNFDTYMTYAIASGWKLFKGGVFTEIAADAELDGTYVLCREVLATADEDLDGKNDVEAFAVLEGNKVTVPSTVTKAMMEAAKTTELKLTFTAYAIQKAGFDTPEAAWTEAAKLG